MFHHDPDHNDEFLDRMGAEARKLHADTIAASEGLTLSI